MRFPICNNRPERAPQIMGHTFFLCWRCTMVDVGLLLTLFAIKIAGFKIPYESIAFGGVLMIPMIIDGGLQYLKKLSSTNWRRAVTGFLFGVGVTVIINAVF